MQCTATTRKGDKCPNKCKSGETCGKHTKKDECAICFRTKVLQATPVCEHKFCPPCMARVDKCPMCRKEFTERHEDSQDEFDELEQIIIQHVNNQLYQLHDHLDPRIGATDQGYLFIAYA